MGTCLTPPLPHFNYPIFWNFCGSDIYNNGLYCLLSFLLRSLVLSYFQNHILQTPEILIYMKILLIIR